MFAEQIRNTKTSGIPEHLKSPSDKKNDVDGVDSGQFIISPDPTIQRHHTMTTAPAMSQSTSIPYFPQDSPLGPDGLPRLQFEQIMKCVCVQLNGDGNNIVFCNQLSYAIPLYGCYLKPLQDLRLNESVCPGQFDNILITTHRKQQMSGCIY